MAIEFNCPYCTAAIRVPDAYAGKQGRCPKCDTKLLIPYVPLPNQTAAPQQPVVQTAPVTPNDGRSVAAEGLPVVTNVNGSAPEDPFSVRPVTTSVVKSRRRNARRRPSRALVIGYDLCDEGAEWTPYARCTKCHQSSHCKSLCGGIYEAHEPNAG